MKNIIFFPFTLFIVFSAISQEIHFDSATENIKGGAREVVYKNYKIRPGGDKDLKYKFKYVFDKTGRLSEKIKFGYDGKPDSREIYKYNNGHIISVISQKINGKKDKQTFYHYTTNGKLQKVIKKNSRGDVEYEITYKYDSKGRVIQKEKTIPNISYTLTEKYIYNNDTGKPAIKHKKTRIGTTKEVFEYDTSGRITKKSEYNAVGELYSVIVYQYNRQGDKTTLEKYDGKKNKTYWETYKYQYDSHGNWVKKSTYKKDKLSSEETRSITY